VIAHWEQRSEQCVCPVPRSSALTAAIRAVSRVAFRRTTGSSVSGPTRTRYVPSGCSVNVVLQPLSWRASHIAKRRVAPAAGSARSLTAFPLFRSAAADIPLRQQQDGDVAPHVCVSQRPDIYGSWTRRRRAISDPSRPESIARSRQGRFKRFSCGLAEWAPAAGQPVGQPPVNWLAGRSQPVSHLGGCHFRTAHRTRQKSMPATARLHQLSRDECRSEEPGRVSPRRHVEGLSPFGRESRL
jgi:uncharacterized ParB-like nuclease family protein